MLIGMETDTIMEIIAACIEILFFFAMGFVHCSFDPQKGGRGGGGGCLNDETSYGFTKLNYLYELLLYNRLLGPTFLLR